MVTRLLSVSAQGYDDMFESGNFKRRKRMRRHSYRTGLYKEWMAAGQSQLYRPTYPGTALYMSGYTTAYPNPLTASYSSPVLPQLSPPCPPSYPQYSYVDNSSAASAAASSLSSFSSGSASLRGHTASDSDRTYPHQFINSTGFL